MGRKITEEQIIQINEVYAQCKVKSQTAQIVGVSPATVSRYLIEDYIPISQREQKTFTFTKEPPGADDFINYLRNSDNKVKAFCEYCNLTEEEWNGINEIQKGLFI